MAATKSKKPSKNIKPTSEPRYRKLRRKDKKKAVKLGSNTPGSFRILWRALNHLWQHKKTFFIVYVIYAVLYVLLVRGLAMNFQLSSAQTTLEDAVGGEIGGAGIATSLFGALLSTAGETTGEAATVYQLILLVLFSLVIIWLLRVTYENKDKVKIKQAFYQSMYPLVQYLLVWLVIMVQITPALISVSIYSAIVGNGIATSGIEQLLWAFVMVLGIAVSSYFVSSSLFASYIVTLSDAEPVASLRSARKLAKYRRFAIIRKVLFLPAFVFLLLAVMFIPLIAVAPFLAEVLFMLLSMFAVFVFHAYFYTLYRELI